MSGFATDLELTAEGAAPEWVHLIPPGRFTARDGRVFDNTDPGAIIEAFDRNGADLPVDYQHQNDRPEATRELLRCRPPAGSRNLPRAPMISGGA